MSKLTVSDYIRSGDRLLSDKGGRRKIFELIKEKIRTEKPTDALWGIRTLLDLIEGTSIFFNDINIPGFYQIKRQREYIVKEGKECLRDCFDNIKRLAVKSEDTEYVIDFTYTVIKYLVQVDPDVESYTDIYLILAYNLMRAPQIRGEFKRVENLVIKGFLRYDAKSFAKHIRGDIEFPEGYDRYEQLSGNLIRRMTEGAKTRDIRHFTPAIFTDSLTLIFINEIFSGKSRKKEDLKRAMLEFYNLSKKDDFMIYIEKRANFLEIPLNDLRFRVEQYLAEKIKFLSERLMENLDGTAGEVYAKKKESFNNDLTTKLLLKLLSEPSAILEHFKSSEIRNGTVKKTSQKDEKSPNSHQEDSKLEKDETIKKK